MQLLDARRHGLIGQRAPFKIGKQLELVPARGLVILIIGQCGGRRSGSGRAVRAGGIGRVGGQIVIGDEARGVRMFVHAARAQRAKAEIAVDAQNIAISVVLVLLAITGDVRGICRATVRRIIACSCARARSRRVEQIACALRRDGLVVVCVVIQVVFNGHAVAHFPLQVQIVEAGVLDHVVIADIMFVGGVVVQPEVHAVGRLLGLADAKAQDRARSVVGLVIADVVDRAERGQRDIVADRHNQLAQEIAANAAHALKLAVRRTDIAAQQQLGSAQFLDRAGLHRGDIRLGVEAAVRRLLAHPELFIHLRRKQVDCAAEIGLAHVARRARAAIDHRCADGRAGEKGRRMVGGVIRIAKGDPVERDVELAILKAAHRGVADIADAAAVCAKAVDRRGDRHGGGVVTAFRRRLFDKFVRDQRFRLSLENRGLGRRIRCRAVAFGGDNDLADVGAFGPGGGGHFGRRSRCGACLGKSRGSRHGGQNRCAQQCGEFPH